MSTVWATLTKLRNVMILRLLNNLNYNIRAKNIIVTENAGVLKNN